MPALRPTPDRLERRAPSQCITMTPFMLYCSPGQKSGQFSWPKKSQSKWPQMAKIKNAKSMMRDLLESSSFCLPCRESKGEGHSQKRAQTHAGPLQLISQQPRAPPAGTAPTPRALELDRVGCRCLILVSQCFRIGKRKKTV